MMSSISILSRTIYGEARGEYHKNGVSALIAIANVVMNRVHQQNWFGKTIQEVCHKPWQFSCWNKNDPNYPLLCQEHIGDPLYKICLDVAEKVSTHTWPDLTGGCDHYYAPSLCLPPRWAVGKKPKCQIGQHLFFDLRQEN